MLNDDINLFLNSRAFAVVGASTNREKYGNKVLRCYLQNHKEVYPVHPSEKLIEGIACLQNLSSLPENVQSISIITPPNVTEQVVAAAIEKGIKNIWMQPGSESKKAVQDCLNNGINLIAGGPCILVKLGFKEL